MPLPIPAISKETLIERVPVSFETERLLIRRTCDEDAGPIHQTILESWDALHDEMIWAAEESRKDFARTAEFIRETQEKSLEGEGFTFQFYHRRESCHVGAMGLHHIEWDVPKFEIGYWLNANHWGRGYMTEAVSALSRLLIAEAGAARVEIRCSSANRRSAAVAQRAGFHHEATLANDRRHHLTHELHDTHVYVLLPSS